MVKKEPKEPVRDQLLVTKDEATSKLQKLIDEGEEIAKLPVNNQEAIKQALEKFDSWRDVTEAVLLRIFSTDKMELSFTWTHRIIYSDPLDNFQKIDSYLSKLKSIQRQVVEAYDDVVAPQTMVANKIENTIANTKKMFVIHGRNRQLLDSMFDFLHAIGLDPIEWSQAIVLTGKPTPSIQEIVNTAFREAQAIVVLLSGDDLAKLRDEFIQLSDEPYEKVLTPQARPNVLFEAGMAMAGRQERTVLVQLGQARKFSDIQGLHATLLDNTVEKRMELINKLRSAGCDIPDPIVNQRWVNVGQFTDPFDGIRTNIAKKPESATVEASTSQRTETKPNKLTPEQVTERLIFLKRLQSVSEQLNKNSQGAYAFSILSIYRTIRDAESVKSFLKGREWAEQAFRLFGEQLDDLFSQTFEHKNQVDMLTATATDQDFATSCNKTRELVFKYRRLVEEFIKLLIILGKEGCPVQAWATIPVSKNIHSYLANDYDELLDQITELRRQAPAKFKTLLPDGQLTKFDEFRGLLPANDF